MVAVADVAHQDQHARKLAVVPPQQLAVGLNLEDGAVGMLGIQFSDIPDTDLDEPGDQLRRPDPVRLRQILETALPKEGLGITDAEERNERVIRAGDPERGIHDQHRIRGNRGDRTVSRLHRGDVGRSGLRPRRAAVGQRRDELEPLRLPRLGEGWRIGDQSPSCAPTTTGPGSIGRPWQSVDPARRAGRAGDPSNPFRPADRHACPCRRDT